MTYYFTCGYLGAQGTSETSFPQDRWDDLTRRYGYEETHDALHETWRRARNGDALPFSYPDLKMTVDWEDGYKSVDDGFLVFHFKHERGDLFIRNHINNF